MRALNFDGIFIFYFHVLLLIAEATTVRIKHPNVVPMMRTVSAASPQQTVAVTSTNVSPITTAGGKQVILKQSFGTVTGTTTNPTQTIGFSPGSGHVVTLVKTSQGLQVANVSF